LRVSVPISVLLLVILCSCGGYKQNIMFKAGNAKSFATGIDQVEKNYVIQKNDILELRVYTNKGEAIVDPGMDDSSDASKAGQTAASPQLYTVDINGVVKFPRIREIKVEGLTILQAEEILEKEFNSTTFVESFVILKFHNKRVIVLGSPGGQVIPLANENMRLVEILALAKGINETGKAHNIRILRGNEMIIADLGTFEGYQKNNIIIHSGDVIYVEPIRRPFIEGFREYSPILSLLASLAAVTIIIVQSTE
jgi:polysaccharide biosynthesis/export protein